MNIEERAREIATSWIYMTTESEVAAILALVRDAVAEEREAIRRAVAEACEGAVGWHADGLEEAEGLIRALLAKEQDGTAK